MPELIPRAPVPEKASPRRSKRNKKKSTKWAASKATKAMTASSNGIILLPSSIQAVSASEDEPSKEDKSSRPIPKLLRSSAQHERLRVYHAQVDLLNSLEHPEQSDLDWQVENIIGHAVRRNASRYTIYLLKVVWMGGDKQLLTLEDMKLHDPFLVT